MLLAPELPPCQEPLNEVALGIYEDLLTKSTIPCTLDVALWSLLDAALCSNRFANLRILKVDYAIFDTRSEQRKPPEGYENVVKQLVAPSDWLSTTKIFFPLTCLSDRIRLEGKIITITPLSQYDEVDYSGGVCTGQYP